jgi:spermidine/putrescine transport system permease protein
MKNRTQLPNIYLAVLTVLMYLPIVVVVIYSFNASKQSFFWGGWTLNWYSEVFHDRSLIEALKNSIILGLLSGGIAGIIGTLGAVGMVKSAYKSKDAIEYLSTLPIMIPEIILGMVFMAFFSLLRLPFGMVTLVIGHASFCIPYVYMMVKARLIGIDQSLTEAARDLGASGRKAFLDITLPLISPAIISGMLLSFAMSLDDVVISIFVTGAKTNTLPIKIYTQLKTGVTPKINALSTMMLLSTLIIVVLSQLIGRKKKVRIGESE